LQDHVRTLDMALHASAQGANLSAPARGEYIQQLRVSAGFSRWLSAWCCW
jgi:hypothetical protein